MKLSALDLFTIGIGPSSSHTVGPMRAARRFGDLLKSTANLDRTARVRCDLFGSLALTGRGHATDFAVILGMLGELPESIDPTTVGSLVARVRSSGQLDLLGCRTIGFREAEDLVFHERESLTTHPNGMRFTAFDANDEELSCEEFFSIGGGFVLSTAEVADGSSGGSEQSEELPFPFTSAAELLAIGRREGLSIAQIVLADEECWRPAAETNVGLDNIWSVMTDCIERGCHAEGVLPGGLNVRRRAAMLRHRLEEGPSGDAMTMMDWVSLFALAVNEENAAGGRVVTAPTNGAAGIIPAVGNYYTRFVPGASEEGIRTFLLTAAAIGMLYKRNASVSGAEMGCQGEVGVACSMAAAGLAAVLGGSNEQIEEAAEIGMEHNLGLTCDPIAGLVQVPCIERNTMGAIKAVNAARLAVLYGDGVHHVPLDRVIETMRQTGLDMQDKYKETSRGGLSVNVIDC